MRDGVSGEGCGQGLSRWRSKKARSRTGQSRADGAQHSGDRRDRRQRDLFRRPLWAGRGFDLRHRLRADGRDARAIGTRASGLTEIDHVTHNVYRGNMDVWAGFYEKLFNFREIKYFDIEGKLTGLKSRAMTSPCGKIRIPINESSDDKSQIAEYLAEYKGEGIQHIALSPNDIYETVEKLRKRQRRVPVDDRHLFRRHRQAVAGARRGRGAAEAQSDSDRRRAADGGVAAADFHAERDRADLLRDHSAQGQ